MTGSSTRYRMYKTAVVLALTAGTAAAAFSFSAAGTEKEGDPDAYRQEQVHFTVPGMEGSCRILWISDMHICCGPEDPGVRDDSRQEAQERYDFLRNSSGTGSLQNWKELSSRIDSYEADYAVFGADMVDYASETSLEALEAGLAPLQTPWMYIRADHDYGRWFADMGIDEMCSLHRKIAPQNKIWTERFDAFTLVGLDNTTTAVTEQTLKEFEEICSEGRPVILCTHVPIDQPAGMREADSESLADASAEDWGGRVLCWGDGDEYDTASFSTMERLTGLICAPDSPVIGVLAGHLHLTWEGKLTDTCTEHVFSAAYEDNIGIITVSG